MAVDLTVIILALTALIVAIVTYVKGSGVASGETLALFERIAKNAVLYAEQVGKDLSGEEKKQIALETFEMVASGAGVKLPDDWEATANAMIEMFVYVLNARDNENNQ